MIYILKKKHEDMTNKINGRGQDEKCLKIDLIKNVEFFQIHMKNGTPYNICIIKFDVAWSSIIKKHVQKYCSYRS